ncbi:MAG: DoxX family protein [Bacteroidota bacterium]|nr:DoxX family protein [Bacteroidota bacterium]
MGTAILKLNKWANAHTNIGIDALRVLLGAFLFYKGMFLLGNTEESMKILKSMPGLGGNLFLIHYIAMAHICGAVFICIGLLTRLSSVIQLPILIGAVAVNFVGEFHVANLLQASACLLTCLFFVIYGSGKHSVDHSLKLHM